MQRSESGCPGWEVREGWGWEKVGGVRFEGTLTLASTEKMNRVPPPAYVHELPLSRMYGARLRTYLAGIFCLRFEVGRRIRSRTDSKTLEFLFLLLFLFRPFF